MTCKHNWIFSGITMMTNPPKQEKICEKCGKMGYDMKNNAGDNKYKDVFEKFHSCQK